MTILDILLSACILPPCKVLYLSEVSWSLLLTIIIKDKLDREKLTKVGIIGVFFGRKDANVQVTVIPECAEMVWNIFFRESVC